MAVNPAMGMGFGSDDFYTQMLYQQMMNGGGYGGGTNSWATGGAGAQGGSGNQQTQVKQGPSLTKALGWGIGGGAAVAAGTYFTNNMFNSPLDGDKKVFNKDFMKHFSGEYEAMNSGEALEKYFKNLGTTKNPITAENYSTVMDELFEYMNDPDPKNFELSDELKAMVKKQGIDPKAPDVAKLKSIYADNVYQLDELRSTNGYNHVSGKIDVLDDLVDEFKGLKSADKAAKVEFLRENAATLGVKKEDYAKLLDPATADDVIDDIYKGINIKSRKTALTKQAEGIGKKMQAFAAKWDTKAGFFGKGGFKHVGSKKVAGALDNALSAMRKGKAGKYGLIAAGVAAVGSLILNA